MRERLPDRLSLVRSTIGLRQTPERAEARRRMAEETWLEWTLRDFLRYFYLVGVLVALTFVPLQMSESWLPYNGAAVIDPALVGGFVLVFVLVVLYLAVRGYLFLWKEAGAVNRAIARLAERDSERTPDPTGPER